MCGHVHHHCQRAQQLSGRLSLLLESVVHGRGTLLGCALQEPLKKGDEQPGKYLSRVKDDPCTRSVLKPEVVLSGEERAQ